MIKVPRIKNAPFNCKKCFAESCRVYKYEGGGVMGFLRNILGYGTIEFELKEIRKQLADNHCRKILKRTC